jgi:two-component system, NarL family, response regulator NreC
MEAETIDVLLVDDHQMVLEGLAALLSKDPKFRVVGQCRDSGVVLDKAQELKPRVVVLDITMPGINGLDLCRDLRRKVKGAAVLILTMHDDQEFLARAIGNGASGYVVKGAGAEELFQAIRTVARGELHLPPAVSQDRPERIRTAQEDLCNRLTARERQVFQMIAEGKSGRGIAVELHLSPKTVDAHRTRLMHKLGLHKMGDLVKYAIRRGIVEISTDTADTIRFEEDMS